ncbi:MAG: histidinol-phosphatase [Eubacterium sp.]
MKFNLHTHTTRCHHAKGRDEDYVLAAIRNGYDMIGFSDHAPYVFPNGYRSGFRMETDKTQDYVNSVRALQEKYKDKIDIKLGFEVEYYPQLFDEEIKYLKSFDYDYLILGQHYTDNECESWANYTGARTSNILNIDKYVRQLLDGVKSGYFTYVCHPDLINFTGNRQLYLNKMRFMLERLKEYNIPLEFNFYGYFDNRHYPADDFWKMVSIIGNPVVIGLDAHWPEVYDESISLERMKAKMHSLGLNPIETIELIK